MKGTMTDLYERHQRLIGELLAGGALDPQWEDAWRATPRHRFVPDRIWIRRKQLCLDRTDDPEQWADEVYTDQAITTQLDDGAPSSSTSMPRIVAEMLGHLDARPGMNVLEIGTGTGWNAGLLAARLGDDAVTSIEVDAELAAHARRALAAAGRSPLVVTGDGALGHPARAPYDRIIATATATRIPYAWVAQTRPAGKILVPLGNAFDNGALVSLTVRPGDPDQEKTAAGRFVDTNVSFMFLRDQRPPTATGLRQDQGEESVTGLNPDAAAFDDDGATLGISWRLPEVTARFVDADDGNDDFTFHLATHDSWARVTVTDGADRYPVVQAGARRLWDEVEDAYDWWITAGKPGPDRYGVTVRPEGQDIWLDTPSQIIHTTA